jgi:hypothetical protein
VAIELAVDDLQDVERRLQCTDFVAVTVEEMTPIPAGSNPYRYDLYSLGTPLVRDWIVMHDGYNDARHAPLTGMYLVNQQSGQRIRLRFTPQG